MKLGLAPLDLLVEVIYESGITSSPLISFFNQYGLNKPQMGMLESKRSFARQCLSELNGSGEITECINDILNPSFGFCRPEQQQELMARFNRVLKFDGYEAVEDGLQLKIVPIARNASESHLKAIASRAEVLDHESLRSEIRRIENSIESDSSLAIGSSKEMLESTCKAILSELGDEEFAKDDLPKLVKRTCQKLRLVPDTVPDNARGHESIRLVLMNLATIAQHTAQLRNLYGTGHGKDLKRKGLQPRHARLVVGASSALSLFLLETFEENKN